MQGLNAFEAQLNRFRLIGVLEVQGGNIRSGHFCLQLAFSVIGNFNRDVVHRTVNGYAFLIRSIFLHLVFVSSGFIIRDVTKDDLSFAVVLHRLYYLAVCIGQRETELCVLQFSAF